MNVVHLFTFIYNGSCVREHLSLQSHHQENSPSPTVTKVIRRKRMSRKCAKHEYICGQRVEYGQPTMPKVNRNNSPPPRQTKLGRRHNFEKVTVQLHNQTKREKKIDNVNINVVRVKQIACVNILNLVTQNNIIIM